MSEYQPNIAIPGGPMPEGVPVGPGLPPYIPPNTEVVQVNVVPTDPIVDKLNLLIQAVNDFDDRIIEVERALGIAPEEEEGENVD